MSTSIIDHIALRRRRSVLSFCSFLLILPRACFQLEHKEASDFAYALFLSLLFLRRLFLAVRAHKREKKTTFSNLEQRSPGVSSSRSNCYTSRRVPVVSIRRACPIEKRRGKRENVFFAIRHASIINDIQSD